METIGAKALEDFADNIKVPATPFPSPAELCGLLGEQALWRGTGSACPLGRPLELRYSFPDTSQTFLFFV